MSSKQVNQLSEQLSKVKNKKLLDWVDEVKSLCTPADIYVCDGTTEEYNRMMGILEDAGLATRLNEKLRPNSFLFRTDPTDVARVEDRTYISCKDKENAGPTSKGL